MKKLVLTMASLVMLASMAFAQETPMLPESHGLTANQPAWGGSQTFNLVQGWNWWSTYINTTQVADVENALGNNGQIIKSSSVMVENNDGVWDGQLSAIDISNMYVIQMATDTTVTLRGSRATSTSVPIAINNGWNWIGYPVSFTENVDYALSNYSPTDADVIKGSESMKQYDALTGTWNGQLDQLEPGIGYKLQSNGTASTSFTFPAVPASGRSLLTPRQDKSTKWTPIKAANPDNMNIVAVVNLDNEELRSDNVEIGVFNGEICRGAVRPMYVEILDQYIVFLTMYGENNEPFSFRLLDESGNVFESDEASVSFKADAVIGKLRSPFALNFSTKNSFAGA